MSCKLIALDHVGSEVEVGELITAVSVNSASIVRDVHENIRNLMGGKLNHYERLLERTLEQALAKLETKAVDKGYDGVIGIKISHPTIVEGGVEVLVIGNGFKYKS